MQDVIVRYRAEISSVRDVLADKFVGVLNKAFLPGGIGVGKEDFCMEHLGDVLVIGELGPVVGGDGEYVTLEWVEQPDDETGNSPGVLAFRRLCHQEFL